MDLGIGARVSQESRRIAGREEEEEEVAGVLQVYKHSRRLCRDSPTAGAFRFRICSKSAFFCVFFFFCVCSVVLQRACVCFFDVVVVVFGVLACCLFFRLCSLTALLSGLTHTCTPPCPPRLKIELACLPFLPHSCEKISLHLHSFSSLPSHPSPCLLLAEIQHGHLPRGVTSRQPLPTPVPGNLKNVTTAV